MKLSDFIRSHAEEISQEWEAFARTCAPAAARMTIAQLRDHILPLLLFIAEDMESSQTGFQQSEKAQGRQPLASSEATGAQVHAGLRIIDGFTVDQVVGEFRALRASILRLWAKDCSIETSVAPAQITRFNEAIDQLLSESVVRHAQLEAAAHEQAQHRDAFLATLSHELRGPLGAIANCVRIVDAAGATNPSLGRVAAMMTRQTRHLTRLLNDLLDLARISRDRLSLSFTPTDIRECVQDAIEGNRDGISQRAHILTVNVPEAPLLMEVDGTRIVEVISNLLDNAVKYSPPGSKIEVSLTRGEEEVIISVKDNGIGLEVPMLPRIFDAFYSSHERNLAKVGLGIGLWLSRRLVEMHSGTLTARSEGPGRGAEFCVSIPIRAPRKEPVVTL